MTPLAETLIARIDATGPITLAEYMATCLGDPEHGYYTTRDPLGAAGDFTTAPEISQMFGELIGLCLVQAWLDRGAPERIVLCELGPGRGTLMADLLRATRGVPGFLDALSLHLVETSPTLRKIQSDTITHPFQHHDTIDALPDGPLYLIANEFFDALPIRQFQRFDDRWRERVVGVKNGTLVLGLADPMPPGFLSDRLRDTVEGDIVETCAAGEAIIQALGQRIATQDGVALIVDYGGWQSLGDTFQALRAHDPVNRLSAPGQADLTAHVAFAPLARAAAPATATAMTPQGVFLERLGITARAQALARNLGRAALEAHVAAHRRLTHPEEMGTLFKAMALIQPGSPTPPGFEDT